MIKFDFIKENQICSWQISGKVTNFPLIFNVANTEKSFFTEYGLHDVMQHRTFLSKRAMRDFLVRCSDFQKFRNNAQHMFLRLYGSHIFSGDKLR